MVVINSITKCAHFISTVTMISAAGVAHLFLNHQWKHHGLPQKVVSDRGPQFIAEFTRELYQLLGIKLAPVDPIPGRQTSPPPLPEIVDGKEEWVVEEILDN